MTASVYIPSAYNSQEIPQQPPRPEKNLTQRLLASGQNILPWCQPTASICTRIGVDVTPSTVRQQEKHSGGKESFWNAQSLEMYTGNGWARAYLIISAVGKVVVQFITPLAIFSILISYIITSGEYDAVRFMKGYFLFVMCPSSLIWAQFELYNRGYWKPWLLKKLLGARKTFELNRRTGMVTLYKRNGKVRYSHPFIEFDCILATSPSQQGLINYSLLLAHRYSGAMHGVPLGSLVTPHETTEEYARLWNMIQCYMDISQPLPDSLILEESRHLDPVTAEFDQKINRDPRYWRDMSDEDYAKTIAAIQNQQRTQPETGSVLNIFAEAS